MTTVVQLIPDTREIVVVLSQTGGLSADQIAAIQEANAPDADNPFATMSIFDGLAKIAVVDALPDPQVTGTLYMVKS